VGCGRCASGNRCRNLPRGEAAHLLLKTQKSMSNADFVFGECFCDCCRKVGKPAPADYVPGGLAHLGSDSSLAMPLALRCAKPAETTYRCTRATRHPAGRYLVAVTHDQNGSGVVAEGAAATAATGTRERVTVDLDLRSTKAGSYFLSTRHEQDQAAYYYPLQIH